MDVYTVCAMLAAAGFVLGLPAIVRVLRTRQQRGGEADWLDDETKS